MSLKHSQEPFWTFAWTRWGTRCSALVQGETILKALDGFTRIRIEDVACVRPQKPRAR